MNYNGLHNHPGERTIVTFDHVWWDGIFTDEELDKIVEQCRVNEMKRAVTLGGENEEVRISQINWQYWSPEADWIFSKLNNVITIINNRWFGFILNGYESFQFTEYDGVEKAKYDWHMDMCMGSKHLPSDMTEPRKLSLTLFLNEQGKDYQGGDFQFNLGREAEAKTAESKKGRIIAFPSWVLHRVTPVTEGIRRSLVVWVTGPKFG